MPNVSKVIGMPIAPAIDVLKTAGFAVGSTTVEPNRMIGPGSVTKTRPPAGTDVATGSSVDIAISSGPQNLLQLLADNYQSVFFNIFAALLLGFFAFQLRSGGGTFLEKLADKEIARGLITFLVTATAAGLFIVMAISTIVLNGVPEADKGFERGKQVLTMLVGILGTIVGFYFGTAAAPQAPSLKVSDVKVEPAQAGKGQRVTISATISGGTPPYTYSINFTPPLNIVSVANKTAKDGKVAEEIAVPADLTKDQEVEYAIVVKDSAGKSETVKGDKKIGMKAAAPAAPPGGVAPPGAPK